MSSREQILQAVRAAHPPSTPLPDVQEAVRGFPRPDVQEAARGFPRPDVLEAARGFPLAPGDLAARFTQAAAAAGARVLPATRAELPRLIAETFPGARRVLSLLPTIPGNALATPDPRELADLDLLVCEAVLGVAENGAVWLPESRAGARAALFLPAQVCVVLDRAALVGDLHQAYARLDAAAEGFGVFVAGPSKTADIEQSLVVGAHGPRALTIVLTASSND